MVPELLYIDAGSGSMLLAAIASGATGLWFVVRSKYYSLKDKIVGRKNPAKDDSAVDSIDR